MEGINKSLLEAILPLELLQHFEITSFEILCGVSIKQEYWLIDFQEKNILPLGYNPNDYETKDFTSPKLVQDFPLRGRGVFLRMRCRRWRHKLTGAIIRRDNFIVADGSKFTLELSAFLKDTGGYASRYHE